MGKTLRAILLALLASLIVGLVIGTWLRIQMERPVRYIGSAPGSLPLDVGNAGPVILDTSDHEQQVG